MGNQPGRAGLCLDMNLSAQPALPRRGSLAGLRPKRRDLALVMAAMSLAISACAADRQAAPPPPPSPSSTSAPAPEPPVTLPDTTPVGAAAFLGPIKLARLADTTIGYRQFGKGAPLIMIMGSDAAMSIWDYRLLRDLAAHARITIFDNPGVASSSAPPDRGLSIKSMALDTIALMDALGIQRADLLGWSMGAYVALELVTKHPDRADRLILAAGDAGSPNSPQGSAEDLSALSDPATPTDALLDLLFPTGQDAAKQAYLAAYAAVPQEQVDPDIRARQADAIDAWARPLELWVVHES